MIKVSWLGMDASGSWPVTARAKEFLKGTVATVEEPLMGDEGWVRPLRFTAEQNRALSSCAAWHPALYRSQAQTTAGVRLEIETSASRLAVELARDGGGVWGQRESDDEPKDGFSIDVDDTHIETLVDEEGPGTLVVELGDALEPRVVRFWLPYLSGCRVRNLMADAEVTPAAPRKLLLVFGDSITQGEAAFDPGLSWTSRLVREAGVDLVNQGLLGQVYQPSAISTLGGAVSADYVWVAYGANYRHEECYFETVKRDIRAALAFLRRQYRDCPIWLATPTPHDEMQAPSHAKSCWQDIPEILADTCKHWPQFALVEGEDLLDDDPAFLADADHPNAKGHAQMASRIARVLSGEDPIDAKEREARTIPAFLREIPSFESGEESNERDSLELVDVRDLANRPSVVEVVEDKDATRGVSRETRIEELRAESVKVEDLDVRDARDDAREDEVEATTVLDLSVVRAALDKKGSSNQKPTKRIRFSRSERSTTSREITDRPPASKRRVSAREEKERPSAAERRAARRRRTIQEDAQALLELLQEGPIDSVPLEQVLTRSLGEPTYVSEGFCSVDLPNGSRILWGEDVVEAKRVLTRQKRPLLFTCLSPGLEPMVRRIFATEASTIWYTLAVYEGTDPLPMESDLRIETLDGSWAGFVSRTYSHPEAIDGAELAHMLNLGQMLGGFDGDGNLVGFIGEWAEGAMGLLEVLPRARRRGYGSALESAKINEHLARGWTPFCQIIEGNEPSLRLQRALGLTLAKTRQCYIPMSS